MAELVLPLGLFMRLWPSCRSGPQESEALTRTGGSAYKPGHVVVGRPHLFTGPFSRSHRSLPSTVRDMAAGFLESKEAIGFYNLTMEIHIPLLLYAYPLGECRERHTRT